MRNTVSDHVFWRDVLPWAAGAAALLSGASLLFRMLWFDEVLTVNLLMKLPLSRIYFAYEIPNNHIVFTLLEKIWFSLLSSAGSYPYYFFRIPPMIFGAAAVFLLSRKLIRSCGLLAGILVSGAFAVSAVYALYATAVRGYMLGFLLMMLAMQQAEKVIQRGGFRNQLGYFLLALLSVGTAPTNLAALTGVWLYFLPAGIRRGGTGIKRSIYLLSAPFFALLLFYLPIHDKIMGCIRLGEGWHSAASAFYTCSTGMLFPVCGLLIFCFAGALLLWRKVPRWRGNCLCGLLILLLPALAYGVMKVPPFPRVFFPLLAVWLFLLAQSLNGFLKMMKHRQLWIFMVFLLQGSVSLLFFQERAAAVSSALYDMEGRQDDFIAPYYARSSFVPNRLLTYLKNKYEDGERFHVFATFDADAPSLVFAGGLVDFPEGVLLADTLNRPKTVRLQDQPGPKYIISGSEADLERTKERFGFRSTVLEKRFGCQRLDRVLDP